MDKKRNGFSGTGISLLVIVFAVLALTIFSVLSLMTTRQQLSLTKKSAATQEAYYDAEYKATKKFNELSRLISNDYEAAADAAESCNAALTKSDGYAVCSFSERINEKMMLICEFSVSLGDGKVNVNKWYCANIEAEEETTETSRPQISNRPGA